MISFVSSIWLWAIAGISIPVIIHLWNIRKGKTLKIGSISFFNETPVSRARSLRLTDLLQLFIRCLLFIILSFFIARPLLMSKIPVDKGWLLIEKSSISSAYNQYGKEIDSLLSNGIELHEFGGEFATIGLEDSSSSETDSISYWALLRLLQKKIPAGLPIKIYTENKLARFDGDRPELAHSIEWKFISSDRKASWIESAYLSYDDSVVIVEGNSSAKEISFNRMVVAISDPIVQQDQMSIKYKGDSLVVDTGTLTISVFSDAGRADARYLLGAIDAIKEFTKRKIRVDLINDIQKTGASDWLFWLSQTSIPADLKTENIFAYAGGKSKLIHSNFMKGDVVIPVYQVFNDSSTENHIRTWQTGSGDLILSQYPEQKKFVFYSRFDPQWNEWVWNEQFPKYIMDLLFPTDLHRRKDERMIDEQQVLPIMQTGSSTVTGSIAKDISALFWFFGFGLFILERLLAYRKQKMADG